MKEVKIPETQTAQPPILWKPDNESNPNTHTHTHRKKSNWMGKSLPSSTRLQELTRIIASDKFSRPNRTSQVSQVRVSPPQTAKLDNSLRVDPERVRLRMESSERQSRVPLSRVVSDCAKRWFQDALKEAKGGDTAMQVLVGQMYHSGYGVTKDPNKVNFLFVLTSISHLFLHFISGLLWFCGVFLSIGYTYICLVCNWFLIWSLGNLGKERENGYGYLVYWYLKMMFIVSSFFF